MKYKNIYNVLDKESKRNAKYQIFYNLLVAISDILSLAALIPVIDVLTDIDKAKLKYSFITDLLSNFSINASIDFNIAILLYLIAATFKLFISYFVTTKQSIFVASVGQRLTNKLYNSYITRGFEAFKLQQSSEIVRNITSEIHQYINGALHPLVIFVSEFFVLLSITIVVVYIDFTGFLIVSANLILLLFLFNRLTSKRLKTYGSERQELDGVKLQIIIESAKMIKMIKIYDLYKFFYEKLKGVTENSKLILSKQMIISQISRPLIEYITVISIVMLGFFSIQRGMEYSEIIVIFTVFSASAFRALPSVAKIIWARQQISYSSSSIDLLYKELDEAIVPNKLVPPSIKKFSNLSKIEFKNVSYSIGNTKIIENINLILELDKNYGIVGASGSGKSTFLELALGLLNPTEGSIFYYDDQNFLVSPECIHFGYVPQTAEILNESIFNNICLGHFFTESKVRETLNECQLKDFIDDLHFQVGENGGNLSGGQRQRLSIARAVVRCPDLLVFDEFTSALDEISEGNVVENLEAIKIPKLIVAHRVKSLKYCAQIIYFDNGKVSKIEKR